MHTFDPARRAVLTTDASNVAVAAILTQQDNAGQQHPVAYESSKLTAAERNYPGHVLELRAFQHYLLGGGALRLAGCWSDFDLRTDNQAITWLKMNKHLDKMCVRWPDKMEDFHFDVTYLPGSRNPTDPLSRRGFADGDGPAASTGDAAAESQQELSQQELFQQELSWKRSYIGGQTRADFVHTMQTSRLFKPFKTTENKTSEFRSREVGDVI